MWRIGIRLYQDTFVKLKKQPGNNEPSATPFLKGVTNEKGQPLDPLLPIANSVCNMVCAVAFGHRYPMDDNTFQRLIEEIDLALKSGGSFIYAKKALSSRKAVLSFVKKEIKKHKECRALHEPQDFVDLYLVQIEKTKGRVSSAYNEEKLAECILDLFISGAETTATSLQWGLLLMAIHPDIQEKVFKETEDVLGSSHSISYQDWKTLPYTCAVIHEIQRTKYTFLFRIIRQAAKDGTFINPNLNSVLLDPEQWETPEKFNPNHFLDKSGKFVAREEFQLFGSGDSMCLEEQLARIELFSFFTTLLRAFRFQLPGGEKKLSKESRTGLTTYPHSYQLCAVPHYKAS
ncbi:hypothetical protein JD844_007991 [Phrynosoma platyrhinos]|uniref:Uncharacterized protein n=1 Tax=Phrynosoma platyrhinos TaxID=52577 RepID=A0ABQ7T3T4_PHRPL|nr:hypothetical protein JD844_007991 [Phrynosoma platyrhinos]